MSPLGKYSHCHSESFFPAVRRRQAISLTTLLLLGVLVVLYRAVPDVIILVASSTRRQHSFDGTWQYERDKDNLILNTAQCEQAFPGLFEEIERAMRDRLSRPITLEEIDSITPENCYIRAMIYDGRY